MTVFSRCLSLSIAFFPLLVGIFALTCGEETPAVRSAPVSDEDQYPHNLSEKTNQLDSSITVLPATKILGEDWVPRSKSTIDPQVRPASNTQGPQLPLLEKQKPDKLPELEKGKLNDKKDAGEVIPTLPTPIPKNKSLDEKDAKEEDKDILLSAARNAVRAKKWDEALSRFESYFRRFGDDFEIRQEYIGLLQRLGRIQDALREYQQLVIKRPKDRKLRLAFGDAALQARDFALATQQFQEAFQLAPDNMEILIRVARSLAFDNRFLQAQELFDKYLSKFRPSDNDTPRTLGAILLDLDRPQEALPFLTALQEQTPDDGEIIGYLIRAYGRLDDRPKAFEAIKKLETAKRAEELREEIAEALYGSGDYDLAQAIYQQMLQTDPNNSIALLTLARTHIQLFCPREALAILHTYRPAPESDRLYRLARGEYHQLLGEYTQAKQFFKEGLVQNPEDYEVRFALAALLEALREDEKGKAEYSKIPPQTGLGRRARLGIASILTTQRRFPEAIEVCHKLLAENQSDGAAIAQLARIFSKSGDPSQGESQARAYLGLYGKLEPYQISVKLALIRCLIDSYKYQDAIAESEKILLRPGSKIPVSYYGLIRALLLAGDKEKAKVVTVTAVSRPRFETRHRLLLSDLFNGDFDDPPSLELAQEVALVDPAHVPALVRVAEAQSRLARPTALIDPALVTIKNILELSPLNERGLLVLARTLSIVQDWKASATEYEKIITADTELLVPQREKARVLYSDNQFASGNAAYLRALQPNPKQFLSNQLNQIIGLDPQLDAVLKPYLAGDGSSNLLKNEISKAIANLSNPQLATKIQRDLFDYEARKTEVAATQLEAQIKDRQWRPYEAISLSNQLLTIEPANTTALFDLGQAHSTIRQTRKAIDVYNRQLVIDPREREAAIAVERAGLELQPQLHFTPNFFKQKGRDGLAQIERTRYTTFARFPYRDEDEYLDLGYTRANYRPTDDVALQGNILTLRGQIKPIETLLVFGQMNIEDFQTRFDTRPTFDAGVRYYHSDALKLRVGGFLENVAENGETMRQDIYRGGIRLGADYQHSRRLSFTGSYNYARYSDDNDYNELYTAAEYIICFAPKQLKFVLNSDIQNFREGTIRASSNPFNLVGTIHPYFAPDFFIFYEARIEYTQWLSRDYFVHSNQCYYSLQYGLGWDNSFNSYHSFRALFNYDIKPCLTIGADVKTTLSDVYDTSTALGYIQIRFPYR